MTTMSAAMCQTEDCRQAAGAMFDGVDALLAPCVDGEAPEGLAYPGNPRFAGAVDGDPPPRD